MLFGESRLASQPSFAGFSRLREWGSRKQSLKHLWKWKEGLKRCLISAHCVTTAYTHTEAHTGRKTYMCSPIHTETHNISDSKCITPSAFDTNTFRALPTPTSSLTHSLSPKLPLHFLFFLLCTWFKSCISGLLDWSTKALLMHPGEAPLERPPSHPG